MRKILVLSLVTFISFIACAQKGVVKDARRSLKSDDLKEARTLIQEALQHEETANNPETWKLAGDIGDKAFDNEVTKEMLGEDPKQKVMYNGLMEAYDYYLKADSMGQVPDSEGRVRNEVREDISETLKANHPYFINGGVYHNEQGNPGEASEFFIAYWDIPQLEMYDEYEQEFNIDSTYQTIKYYAIVTALQSGNHEKAVELLERATDEPFIENSAYVESDLYELLASEYVQLGDTASYLDVLEVGAEKFPTSKYFLPNMINVYIQQGDNEKALAYLDDAIANDSTNACDLNSVKAALFVELEKYDEAEAEFKKALAHDENCNRALEGLALNYILQAQKIKDKSAQEMDDRELQAKYDEETVELYLKSLPHLEKFTENLKAENADESVIKGALIKLQNVYYNLSNLGVDKSKELEDVEAQLGTGEEE